MINFLSEFGERVRQRRLDLGLTQLDLARECGYKDVTTISKIEKGERDIPRKKVVILAEVLRVPPSYLMGWSKTNESPPVTFDFGNTYSELNEDGKNKLKEYAELLLSQNKYKK